MTAVTDDGRTRDPRTLHSSCTDRGSSLIEEEFRMPGECAHAVGGFVVLLVGLPLG